MKILINFSSQLIPRRNTRKFSSVSHPNRFPDEIREISHQFLIPIASQTKYMKNLIKIDSHSLSNENSHQN
jgi:hypothetical protein